jgi:hypothetical protein
LKIFHRSQQREPRTFVGFYSIPIEMGKAAAALPCQLVTQIENPAGEAFAICRAARGG